MHGTRRMHRSLLSPALALPPPSVCVCVCVCVCAPALSILHVVAVAAFFFADGHTVSNAPDLFRPPKLSGTGPGQYWGGGPPGKPLGCCQLFILPCCSSAVHSLDTGGGGVLRTICRSPSAGYFVYATTYTPSPMRQGRQRPDAEMSRRKKSAKQTSCTIRLYTSYCFNQRCVLRKFRSPPAGSSVDATTYTHWPKHQRPRRPDAGISPRTQSAKQTPPEGDAGEAGV